MPNVKRLTYLLFVISVLSTKLTGQGRFYFGTDRIEVGKPFIVALEIKHPSNRAILFPDSLAGFETVRFWAPTPTKTQNGISSDTRIYILRTWEIDSLQPIQGNYQILYPRDTQWMPGPEDTLYFQAKIISFNNQLKPKLHTEIEPISLPPNPLRTTIIILIFFAIVSGTILLLYKPIKKVWKKYQIYRKWKKFEHKWEALTKYQQAPEFLINMNKLWKSYLEQNHKLNLKAATTKELPEKLANIPELPKNQIETLTQANLKADQTRYAGHKISLEQIRHLQKDIKNFLKEDYTRRKEALSQ